jgi:hypothetical protein
LELFDEGGGDNPVSTKEGLVAPGIPGIVLVDVEPTPPGMAVGPVEPGSLWLSQEPGGADEFWPRKLSPC